MKHRVKGGILATVGYLLSPLSWWNDIIINIPLAYAFAFPFGLISRKLFVPMMILGYWITNITGLILFHQGVKDLVTKEKIKYTKKDLAKDVIISIIYTAVVVVLVKLGWLKFPLEYFK
jgi:hypothetical protein